MSEKPTTKITVSVVSGLILAGLIWLFKSYLKVAALWVWGVIVACWNWFFTMHPVQGWLIAVMAVSLIIVLAQAIQRVRKSKKNSKGVHELFRSGYFEGFYWRWRYDSWHSIHSLTVYCPDRACDLQLYPKRAYTGYQQRDNTEIACGRCGTSQHIAAPPDTLEHLVIREIQRLIRTGQWEQHPR